MFLGAFFFFEETMYFRQSTAMDNAGMSKGSVTVKHEENVQPVNGHDKVVFNGQEPPRRKTYWQQLKVWDKTDHNSPFFIMMVS